ncbi:MAG: 4'-phosphopantetheinyl transferase superfamily protein [bacterium]|nr:4'-phosphopantetheinyl transferase superfamily protein [bacterium]
MSAPGTSAATSSNHYKLSPGEIHVWWASVESCATHLDKLENLLDTDDLRRVNRIRVERPRLQNLLAHGAVRMLLGDYTGLDPLAIRFSFGERGRPFLAPKDGVPPVDFNLSHSGDLVVFALSVSGPIGIDLETKREAPSAVKLAKRFFSPNEHAYIEALPVEDRAASFLHCWTCKEALLKATGEGLAGGGLRRVEVIPDPTQPPQVVRIGESSASALGWHLYRLKLPVSATCTVASRNAASQIKILNLTDRLEGPLQPASLA